MAEWKCVFDGEIKKRPVVVKSYDSGDEEPAVRVTAVPIGDARAHWGSEWTSLAGPEGAGSIILDPATFADSRRS
jgi:hypothetical protein